MRGQPGHNTRLHARLPPSFQGMERWIASQLNVALSRKLRGSLMCLAHFWHAIHGCLYIQAQLDVRSIGAGIKCLHCRNLEFWFLCHFIAILRLIPDELVVPGGGNWIKWHKPPPKFKSLAIFSHALGRNY